MDARSKARYARAATRIGFGMPGRTNGVAGPINASLTNAAADYKIPTFAYSRDEVFSAFQSIGFLNKHTLAQLIAKHIPAFARHVPPPRKSWMSEDRRMSLFDAAAFRRQEFSPEKPRTLQLR